MPHAADTPDTRDTPSPSRADAAGDQVELLNLSQVTKLNGVRVDTLRMLIDDRLLPGVSGTPQGHVKLRADHVPTFDDIVELLSRQLVRHLEKARAQMRRVHVEMEAVENDIEMALEDPLEDLGHDLATLHTSVYDPNASTLASALHRLNTSTWEIRGYQKALRELLAVHPGHTS